MLFPATGREDQGFWLTQGMARAMGVDLSAALANGTLDRRGYMGMVSSCGICPYGDACAVWLSESQAEDAGGPGYCRNKPILDGLKARQS
jgi:hypothetical protein